MHNLSILNILELCRKFCLKVHFKLKRSLPLLNCFLDCRERLPKLLDVPLSSFHRFVPLPNLWLWSERTVTIFGQFMPRSVVRQDLSDTMNLSRFKMKEETRRWPDAPELDTQTKVPETG